MGCITFLDGLTVPSTLSFRTSVGSFCQSGLSELFIEYNREDRVYVFRVIGSNDREHIIRMKDGKIYKATPFKGSISLRPKDFALVYLTARRALQASPLLGGKSRTMRALMSTNGAFSLMFTDFSARKRTILTFRPERLPLILSMFEQLKYYSSPIEWRYWDPGSKIMVYVSYDINKHVLKMNVAKRSITLEGGTLSALKAYLGEVIFLSACLPVREFCVAEDFFVSKTGLFRLGKTFFGTEKLNLRIRSGTEPVEIKTRTFAYGLWCILS